METRNKNIKKIIIVSIIVFLIIVIFASPRLVNSNSRVANAVGHVISPVSNFFRNIGISINTGVRKVLKIEEDLDAVNLRVKIAVLEEENRKLNDVISRSEPLKREFEMLKTTNLNLIPVKVVSRTPGSWFDVFKINKGSRSGLKLNDTVVVAAGDDGEAIEGLVGKITELGFDYANVTTIESDNNKVAIRSLRSGDGGIVTGMENGTLKAYMYDRNSDIVVGDVIITSGLGEVYKENVYVGIVDKVENDETNLKKNIYITPAVDTRKLTKVFVVK